MVKQSNNNLISREKCLFAMKCNYFCICSKFLSHCWLSKPWTLSLNESDFSTHQLCFLVCLIHNGQHKFKQIPTAQCRQFSSVRNFTTILNSILDFFIAVNFFKVSSNPLICICFNDAKC